MNQDYTILVSGGNNYLENLKVKMEKDYSQQQQIFQLIYTHWDNIFKMEEESYLKEKHQK